MDPTAEQGGKSQVNPQGWANSPFFSHTFVITSTTTTPRPPDSWPSNQQRSAAHQHPSRSVNQCLFIAGNLFCSGSQPALAPSVLGLWRRCSAAKVGSHWHAAAYRPHGPDVALEANPSHCSPWETRFVHLLARSLSVKTVPSLKNK